MYQACMVVSWLRTPPFFSLFCFVSVEVHVYMAPEARLFPAPIIHEYDEILKRHPLVESRLSPINLRR